MYFLYDHLKEGSFRTGYADTDSMCLGLSRTRPIPTNATQEEYYRCLFDDLVKPSMKESWEAQWKSWFVTTNEISDQRMPGKLKCKLFNCSLNSDLLISYEYLAEFGISKGHFIALSAKCYFTYDMETEGRKLGAKGCSNLNGLDVKIFLDKLYNHTIHKFKMR